MFTDHRWTRRRFLGTALASTAGLILAACGPKGAGTQSGAAKPAVKAADTVTYWNDYGGTNGVVMDDLLGKFTAETGIKVEQQRMQAGDEYAKLRLTTQSGENPDIAMILTFALPAAVRDGILDELDDGTLANRGMKKEDFADVAWDSGVVNGKRYHVPLDAVMDICYLNNAMFKAANLVDSSGKPKVPTTKDEVLQYAKTFTKGTDSYGLAFMGANAAYAFEELLWQNDTNVFTDDFKKSRLAEPAAIEVAEFWGQVSAKDKIAPPLDVDTLKAFQAGKLGIWVTGSWNTTGLVEAKVDFTVVHVPTFFKKPKVWAIIHNYTLPKQGKRDDSKREAAWQMISWFLAHSDDWTLRGGVLGSLKKVQADPRVQADAGLKVMAGSAPDWQLSQPTPKWSDWENKAGAMLEAIWTGKTSGKDAITAMAKEVDAIPD